MAKLVCMALGALTGCMLTFPQAAMAAAREGIALFLDRVLPALFPMLTVMLLITSRLPRAAIVCTLLSLLSGSPAGARLCAGLSLSSRQKHRLAALTGTMSPMFLLSSLPAISNLPIGLPVLICHLAGAALCAFICCPFGENEQRSSSSPPQPLSLSQAIWEALKSMGVVLGCITLSTVLIAMLQKAFPFLPHPAFAVLHLLIEVTGGLKTLADSSLPHRGLLCTLFTSFCGLSILMQNAAFWQKGGVGIMRLFVYRLVHAVISGMLYILLFGCSL